MRRFLAAISRYGVLLVSLVTLATFAARHFWLSDLFANLRMQQIIGILIAVILSLCTRQFRLMCVAMICLAIHLTQMAPHLRIDDEGKQLGKEAIRIMTVNVLTKNQSHDKIIDDIQSFDPDFLAILELSSSLQNHINKSMGEQYPYTVQRSRDDGNFGIGLYSKHPIDSADAFQLNEHVDSIEVVSKGFRIIATHPLPPMGDRLFRSRNEHLKLLAARIQKSRKEDSPEPVIAMGDFNLTPWSPLFGDWENNSGLRRAKRGLAIQPTWYARVSVFPLGLILDHVFLDPLLRCAHYRVGPPIGSDHRSVSVIVGRR